jgi:hypothetical protein
MRDMEDEARIKAYMESKMKHIKMYNECMNLADGLDVEKFAELVRADERSKREWVGLTDEEYEILKSACHLDNVGFDMSIKRLCLAVETKLKGKNT